MRVMINTNMSEVNPDDEQDLKSAFTKVGVESSRAEIEAYADKVAYSLIDALDKGKKKGDIIY